MIRASNNKIGTREFASIIILAVGIKATDVTPQILFKHGENAAWMLPLLSYFIVLIPFFVLLFLMKKHNLGLAELANKLMGKYMGAAIIFLLFLTIFLATAVNIRGYGEILTALFITENPGAYILAIGVLGSYFIASQGIETIGRIAWFFVPVLEVSIFMTFFFTWRFTDWEQIFPIAGPGMFEIIKDSAIYHSIFGDMILLAAYYPLLRTQGAFRTGALIGFTVSSIKLCALLLLYISIFSYPEILNIAFPYQETTRLARFNILTHIEGIFFSFWLIAATIHFAIYLHLCGYLLGKLLKIERYKPLILSLTGIAFLAGQIPDNIRQVNLIRNWLIWLGSPTFFAIPFLLLIFHFFKRRKAAK